MITVFLDQDELTKLITKIDLFVVSMVKYLTSCSFGQTIVAKDLVTVTLGDLEINLFPF